MSKKTKKNAVTALYSRLSRDDEIIGDSNSIVNQKKMLEKYAEDNGYTNIQHFSDDGISGGTFDRPSWKQMIEGVESGIVTTIITRDLSRIGRDYLQVGFYTEVMFREKGVRFIAIANNVDNSKRESAEFAPFLNIMNEWYIRDTSRKVTSVLRARGSDGKHHTTNHAIYGYKKCKDNPSQWLIDEPAASVVKRMFQMCIDGKGPYQIAKVLTEEKVERPSYYLAQRGMGNHISNYKAEEPYLWRGTTVTHMLSKPEYMGHTVNFRTYKDSYKDKQPKKTDKEDWIIFKDTQEPIVDEATWETVQKLKKTKRRSDTIGEANPLTGLMYCADCGAKMYNHRGGAGYERNWCGEKTDKKRPNRDEYNCSTYDLARQDYRFLPCTQHYIRTEAIKNILLETIQEVSRCVQLDEEKFINEIINKTSVQQEKSVNSLKQKITKDNRRVIDLNKLIRQLYEDNVIGKLSDKRFNLMIEDYEEEQKQLEQSIEQSETMLKQLDEESFNTTKFIELIKKYTDLSELTTPMINEFVDKILVHEGKWENYQRTQEIEIYLNFVGKIEITKKEIELTETEILEQQELQKKRDKKREYNYRYMRKRRERLKEEQTKIKADEESKGA